MAKYRELVYMCLDLLKEVADDAFYTEEHVIFMLGRLRALLLKRKYQPNAYNEVPESNYQELCLDLEPADLLGDVCVDGDWLKTTKKIPSILSGVGNTKAYPMSFFTSEYFTFVSMDRLPYTGYNKWLSKIIYCAIGPDDYLYVHSSNPQFKYLKKMKLDGVFENPEKAAELLCDKTDEDGNVACDILDTEFPIEEDLVSPLIEMVVQELAGSRYAPKDDANNASDDLSEIANNAIQQAVQRAMSRYNSAPTAATASN